MLHKFSSSFLLNLIQVIQVYIDCICICLNILILVNRNRIMLYKILYDKFDILNLFPILSYSEQYFSRDFWLKLSWWKLFKTREMFK